MDDSIKTWLYDILGSINEIESYFVDTPKLFKLYQNDLRTKRVVERNIEIIGEAMSRILLRKITEFKSQIPEKLLTFEIE